MWQVDHNGGYYCSQSGTDCDMVIHTQNPDGSYISEVVYPCGILVHSEIGSVDWYQVGSSLQGSGSFAGMTFLPNEYRLEINNYPNDTDYNGLSVPLDGVTADSQGWIHVFIPHP